MKDNRPKLVVITGPTASGKSSLAIDLAVDLGGEIINADSMQVYRSMDVGTAKPSVQERKGIIHHMMDVVDPDEDFNASIYRSLTVPIIKEVKGRGRICFVVGGTGLYIKTLLGGLLKCPPVNPTLRMSLVSECEELGSAFLYERLKRLDPKAALNIHPNDKTRVIRSLEVISLTNQPISSLIMEHGFKERPFQALKIGLQVERAQLYHRINERSISMFKSDLVKETRTLLEKGYSPDLRAMKSLGYRHAIAFLRGDCTLEESVLQLQKDTRRYSKRQLTWFRADTDIVWAEPENRDFIQQKIEEFI